MLKRNKNAVAEKPIEKNQCLVKVRLGSYLGYRVQTILNTLFAITTRTSVNVPKLHLLASSNSSFTCLQLEDLGSIPGCETKLSMEISAQIGKLVLKNSQDV